MREADEYADEYDDATDEPPPDDQLEGALEEALGGEPRADELRQMKSVLAQRRSRLCADLDTAEDATERDALRRQVKKLDEEIAVLGEEAEITRFVEDAVRVGLEMRRLNSS